MTVELQKAKIINQKTKTTDPLWIEDLDLALQNLALLDLALLDLALLEEEIKTFLLCYEKLFHY